MLTQQLPSKKGSRTVRRDFGVVVKSLVPFAKKSINGQFVTYRWKEKVFKSTLIFLYRILQISTLMRRNSNVVFGRMKRVRYPHHFHYSSSILHQFGSNSDPSYFKAFPGVNNTASNFFSTTFLRGKPICSCQKSVQKINLRPFDHTTTDDN